MTGLYQAGDVRRDPEDGLVYVCVQGNCTYGPPHERPDFWQPVAG